jgi:hypothetical protein
MRQALIILLIFFSTNVFCQEHSKFHPEYFSIGYFGEKAFHPGLTGNIGYISFINNDSITHRNRIEFGLGFLGYIHFKNHIGIQVKPQLSYYHIFLKSFELGLKTEIGFMRRIYQGETYELSDAGEVKNVKLAGQNSLVYGAFVSLGQNFWVLQNREFRWFIELGSFWEYPYNNYTLMHPSVSIGISKRIK